MLQCQDCEYFERDPGGEVHLKCDPFSTIKEPECIQKWQLVKLNQLARAYQATVEMYRRIAPLQEKMMRHMEREIDEIDEADKWKLGPDDENDDDDKDDD